MKKSKCCFIVLELKAKYCLKNVFRSASAIDKTQIEVITRMPQFPPTQ